MNITFRTGPYAVDLREEKYAALAPRLLVGTRLISPNSIGGHVVPLNYQQIMKLRDKLNAWLADNLNEGPPLWEEHD